MTCLCEKKKKFLTWQAYTVELAAELNQLREENSQLKQALVLSKTTRTFALVFTLVIQLY